MKYPFTRQQFCAELASLMEDTPGVRFVMDGQGGVAVAFDEVPITLLIGASHDEQIESLWGASES
jgi:nitrous oxide reductase accessory protein NosL